MSKTIVGALVGSLVTVIFTLVLNAAGALSRFLLSDRIITSVSNELAVDQRLVTALAAIPELRGPEGARGAAGPTGPTGSTGPAYSPKFEQALLHVKVESHTGPPQAITRTQDFSRNIKYAWYTVESADMKFTSTEKEIKLVNFKVTEFSFSGKRVTVSGHTSIKDNSGNYDDAYEGGLLIRVYALLE